MAFEYDYHVHTALSYCHEGDLTVDNLMAAARERGLEGFAVADHSAHIYFVGKCIDEGVKLASYRQHVTCHAAFGGSIMWA